MLTQEKLKELLHYCPDTGVFTWRVAASKRVRVGEVAGSFNTLGYARIAVNGKLYGSHRLAWLYMHGEFPTDHIDHINRVPGDNRLCNLRAATQSENMQNKSQYRNNKSGHIGVSWKKSAKKWMAWIDVNCKTIYLGYFTDISEAIAARKAAEPQYHQFNHQ